MLLLVSFYLLADLKSNLICTFIIAPENSFRDELKEQGVTLIATGRRNFSNKSLLSWAESKPTTTPAPTQAPPTVFKLPYQDDYAVAGTPAIKPNQYQSSNVTGHAKGGQRVQHAYKMSVPFGTDPVPDSNSTNNSGGVKSLADVVKAKNTTKSLSSYVR